MSTIEPAIVDPLLALILAFVMGALAIVLLWPDRGLVWRLIRGARASERVQIEDALKHLFDCEYKGNPCTLQSLAGALRISGHRAAELLEIMQNGELAVLAGTSYKLTGEGRAYALRVVRIHRLWEQYLSEETGYGPDHWHEKAELLEHTTTVAEAERLARRMGNPRYDPHGDPIPTPGGEIAPPLGKPLNNLALGELADIVHLEDEPKEVYAQLVAEGLHPGMRVRVNDITPQRITFEADAEEHVLAPVLAANISVIEVSDDTAEMGQQFDALSSLDIGDEATVMGFAQGCRGLERRRLLDLGLIPGTRVRAEIRSPGGDPTGYLIRGAVIALRKVQADLIQIDRNNNSQLAPATESTTAPPEASGEAT